MQSIGSDCEKHNATYVELYFATLWIDDWQAIITNCKKNVHSYWYWPTYLERHSSGVRFVLSIIAFPCGWLEVVTVFCVPSSYRIIPTLSLTLRPCATV